MDDEAMWYWKEIEIGNDLLGDEISKGSGRWEKEYQYIKIPTGYGYDNYCFLLSRNLVKYHPQREKRGKWSFAICFDMNIELIYDPEYRESGKRYKRFKLTGQQLFDEVFRGYELNYAAEYEQRMQKQKEERIKRERKIIGNIVYGEYQGNDYGDYPDGYRDFYFENDGTFLLINSRGIEVHQKVHNVKVSYVVMENVSKHFYRETKEVIVERLQNWVIVKDKLVELDAINKSLLKINLDCDESFQNIQTKLHTTADDILRKLIKDLNHYI